MITRLSDFFYAISSWKVLLGFVFVFILFNVVVFPYVVNRFGLMNQPILDFMFGFTPDQAYSVIGGYGELGREGILWISGLVDMLYPFVFGGALVMFISVLMKKNEKFPSKFRSSNLLPCLAMCSDFIENSAIIVMVNAFPARTDGFAILAATAGIVKWVFVVVSIVTVLGLVLFQITKKVK